MIVNGMIESRVKLYKCKDVIKHAKGYTIIHSLDNDCIANHFS